MTAIPTREPAEIIAGDTLKFKLSMADYPAPEWTLKYSLKGPAAIVDITASADGADHLVDVAAATTAGWTAGVYWYQAYVAKGGERYTVREGQLTVNANLATVSGSHDGRSHVKKVLDALETTLEGKASRDVQEIEINGQRIGKMDPDKLLRWLGVYRQLYRDEQAKERAAQGLATGRRVLVKFR